MVIHRSEEATGPASRRGGGEAAGVGRSSPDDAVLYEHPEFAELDRRRLPYEPIAAALRFDPGERASRHFPPSARPVPSRLMPAATRLDDGQGAHPIRRGRRA
jgi:hypothetical protein